MRVACYKIVCGQKKASRKKLRASYERLVQRGPRCVGRASSVQLARAGVNVPGSVDRLGWRQVRTRSVWSEATEL
jgi:hypothetical protein